MSFILPFVVEGDARGSADKPFTQCLVLWKPGRSQRTGRLDDDRVDLTRSCLFLSVERQQISFQCVKNELRFVPQHNTALERKQL